MIKNALKCPCALHALVVPGGTERNGAKLIVVDPRRIREAAMADLWLPIRPGTNVALMLGWLKIIMDEGLCDRDFDFSFSYESS